MTRTPHERPPSDRPLSLITDPGFAFHGLGAAGDEVVAAYRRSGRQLPDQLDLVVEGSARSIAARAGGPFAAAVFARDSGELVSAAVNCVLQSGLPLLHAELIALTLAHRRTGQLVLSAAPGFRLVSSADPCALCLGAIHWSHVSELYCCATTADVEHLGFDEGPRPRSWVQALRARGTSVHRLCRRPEAVRVLQAYRAVGAPLY